MIHQHVLLYDFGGAQQYMECRNVNFLWQLDWENKISVGPDMKIPLENYLKVKKG